MAEKEGKEPSNRLFSKCRTLLQHRAVLPVSHTVFSLIIQYGGKILPNPCFGTQKIDKNLFYCVASIVCCFQQSCWRHTLQRMTERPYRRARCRAR